MDKLKIWLERNEINYKIATYGAQYFSGDLDILFEGVQIQLNIIADRRAAYETERKVCAYMKRYGYKAIFESSGMYSGYISICIVRGDDFDRLAHYDEFMRASVAECEKLIHFYHVRDGREPETLNNELNAIMARYETEYRQSLTESLTA